MRFEVAGYIDNMNKESGKCLSLSRRPSRRRRRLQRWRTSVESDRTFCNKFHDATHNNNAHFLYVWGFVVLS